MPSTANHELARLIAEHAARADDGAANAAFITAPIFTSALLAIADAWDATCCAAYP